MRGARASCLSDLARASVTSAFACATCHPPRVTASGYQVLYFLHFEPLLDAFSVRSDVITSVKILCLCHVL